MATKSIRLKEIAGEAGVSIGTVSRILSGESGRISTETQRVVREIADNRGYRPNPLVRGMQTGRTRLIGLVAPPENAFWSEIIYGAHDHIFERNYVPLIFWTPRRPDGEELVRKLLTTLIDWQVDGVLFWPKVVGSYEKEMSRFRALGVPIATVENVLNTGYGLDFIGCDDKQGGQAAADYLYGKGHRHVVFAGSGKPNAPWSVMRGAGFQSRCCELGMVMTTLGPSWSNEPGSEAFKTLKRVFSGPNRPTAIFAACDPIGVHCYHLLQAMGLRVPHDVSVLGFGGEADPTKSVPPMTTFVIDAYALGQTAAETIINKAEAPGQSPAPVHVIVPVTLRERDSVATLT